MPNQFQNPFAVQTPDCMSARDVSELFVEFFSDFFNIEKEGHTLLKGHRGSGKSMMFRYMEPDCQVIRREVQVKDLPYYGIYVPIRATDLNLSELARLESKFTDLILSEHIMVVFIGARAFSSLAHNVGQHLTNENALSELKKFLKESLIERLLRVGWKSKLCDISELQDSNQILHQVVKIFDSLYVETISYLRRLSLSIKTVPYNGVLLGFYDFLLPILQELRDLSFMPDGPIFLLIDDADNLSHTQTTILNTWVSYRTTNYVSLKIATKVGHKNYLTVNKGRIEAPHDYSDVNISSLYTTQRDRYPKWVSEIVKRRLEKSEIHVDPEDFFPPDQKQEEAIKRIAEEYKEKWADTGRGYRAEDDAYRYARPEYIKRLQGRSKQGSKYKYAGFIQVIHISSGIIRHFLESASLMFGEQRKRKPGGSVEFVNPTIQNRILRELSDEFLLREFDKITVDEDKEYGETDNVKRLKNLIMTLGAMFHLILLEGEAERRVFSIAISDELDSEVQQVLDLGTKYGYLHEATIGNKEGTGRTKRYVLSRRLAPSFTLDPSGFSGYQFVTNDFLREAMLKPKTSVGRLRKIGVKKYLEEHQPMLFSDE